MTIKQLKEQHELIGGNVLVYDDLTEFIAEAGSAFGFTTLEQGEGKYSGLGIIQLHGYTGKIIELETATGGYTWHKYEDLIEGA